MKHIFLVKEFHQVEVLYEFDFDVNDQAMWSHLLTLALERGSSSVFGLPSLVSNDTEDWKCLLLAVGSDIKELSLPLPNRWLSEEQGTTEVFAELKNQKDQLIFSCPHVSFFEI